MEQILEKLGAPGRYHCIIGILFAITWWSVTLGTVSFTFYGYTPNFTCNTPGHADGITQNHGFNTTLVMTYRYNNETVTIAEDQCSYNVTTASNKTSSKRCKAWSFDDEGRGTKTIVTDYNLVCDEKYKVPLSNTMFFLGVFCGAFIFGIISDHLGRKKTLAISLYLQVPISLAVAFMPEYISFTVLRFILGIWLQGISTVAFIHCIEFFQQRYRSVVMTAFGMSWAFAQLLTAMFGYIFPNWRHMQMASAFVALATAPYFWWLPESPRWLLVKGRFEEIVDIFIRRAARVNGLHVSEMMTYTTQQLSEMEQHKMMAGKPPQAQSFKNVLRTPTLLKRLIGMCYIWCVSSLAYYVFIFNTGNLAGNRYLNFAIGAALEIVVNLIIIFVMIRYGRKRPLIVCCSLVAVFCVISGTIPKNYGDTDISWLVTLFSLLGKMAIAAVMCLIFVYAAELFPTFARGSCLALCGCSMRFGGMVAPQVLYLKNVVFQQFPFIVIAALILLAAIYTFFLPETLSSSMPNTIEEAVEMLPTDSKSTKDQLLTSTTAETITESITAENGKLMDTQQSA